MEVEKRDWMACAAMEGLLRCDKNWNPDELAKKSIYYADALIRHLEETKEPIVPTPKPTNGK